MKVRKLAVALALAGGLGSNFAYALGMGEARITSSLNEPLRAEIELVRPGDFSKDQIRASVASEADFRRAGVEKMFFLRNVEMEVVRNDAGQLVIVVTSDRPVREPFLNFLVELTWPSGRMMREYSFLVDPPGFGAPPVVQAPSAPSAAPAPQRATPPAAEPAPRRPASQAHTQGTYSVSPNDTLWNIAGDVRPADDLTREQVMLALQDLNPDAFMGNNINRLRRDEVLRIPTAEQARQRTAAEAAQGVRQQHQAFAARREAPIAAPIAAAPADTRTRPQPRAGEDELRLVVDDHSASPDGSAGGIGIGEGDADLVIALEELDRAEREKRELSERMQELESQLRTMEQLVALKDDQLAELQAQLGAVGEEPVVPADEIDDESTDIAVAPAPEDPEAIAEPDPEPEVAVEAEETAAEETAAEEEAPAVPEPVVEEETEFSLAHVFEQLRTNWVYQAGAGGVGIGFLSLLWVLARRNARREQDYLKELNGDSASGEDILDLGDFDEDYGDGESAMADESTTAQDDEVLAEADHYVAYGRLDQAAQLLADAISNEPGRTDLRLKLLEVYAESGDHGAFDRQFKGIEALGDSGALEKARKLRDQLGDDSDLSIDDLEKQLKTGSKGMGAAAAASAAVTDSDADDADTLEEPDMAADLEDEVSLDWELNDSAEDQKDAAEADGLDFSDLGESLEDDAKASDEEVATSTDFDFDLEEFELDEAEEQPKAEAAPVTEAAEEDALEFTLDEELESEPAHARDEDAEAVATLSDDELASLGLDEDEPEALSLDDADELSLEDTDELSLDGMEDVALDDAPALSPDDQEIAADTGISVPAEEESVAEAKVDEDKADEDLASVATEEPLANDALSAKDASSTAASDFDDSFLAELDAELDKVTSEDGDNLTAKLDSELDDLELDVSDEDLALLEEVAGEDDGMAAEEVTAELGVPEELDEPEALTDADDAVLETPVDEELPETTALSDQEAAALEDALPESLPLEEAATADASADSGFDDSILEEADAGLEEDEPSVPVEVATGEEDEFDFLEGTDEAGTKLDLARAYIEMGDAEGARDILQEVAEEGSEVQQQEAKKLLGEI